MTELPFLNNPSSVTRFASLALVPPSPEGEGLNYARNDNRVRLVFNVISTGVRAKTERSGEIPRGKNISSVYASKSSPPARNIVIPATDGNL